MQEVFNQSNPLRSEFCMHSRGVAYLTEGLHLPCRGTRGAFNDSLPITSSELVKRDYQKITLRDLPGPEQL